MTTSYLDPVSNVSTAWDDYDFSNIDDGVRYPGVPTAGVNQSVQDRDRSGANTQAWAFGNLAAVSGEETKWVKLWMYRAVPGDTGLSTVDVKFGNVWRGVANDSGMSGNWYWYRWDIQEDISAGITANGAKLTSAYGMDTSNETDAFSGIYIEVDSDVAPPIPSPSAETSPFLMFVDL